MQPSMWPNSSFYSNKWFHCYPVHLSVYGQKRIEQRSGIQYTGLRALAALY